MVERGAAGGDRDLGGFAAAIPPGGGTTIGGANDLHGKFILS
jgi:hypothetical protein